MHNCLKWKVPKNKSNVNNLFITVLMAKRNDSALVVSVIKCLLREGNLKKKNKNVVHCTIFSNIEKIISSNGKKDFPLL